MSLLRSGLMSLVLLWPAFSHAACDEARQQVVNRDGSRLTLLASACTPAGQRALEVRLRDAAGMPERVIWTLTRQEPRPEQADDAVRWTDIDGDGVHELELRGECGAGPNCEGTLYRLDARRQRLVQVFSGGYAQLRVAGAYLIESGRSSCCAWEHQVYRWPRAVRPVTEDELLYRVVVQSAPGERADAVSRCTILGPAGRPVRTADRTIRSLCKG